MDPPLGRGRPAEQQWTPFMCPALTLRTNSEGVCDVRSNVSGSIGQDKNVLFIVDGAGRCPVCMSVLVRTKRVLYESIMHDMHIMYNTSVYFIYYERRVWILLRVGVLESTILLASR